MNDPANSARLEDGVADLHLHTTASDGTCSVAERVDQARDQGLAAIAVTDHDRIAESVVKRVDRRDGVTLVAGVEIRADLFDTKVELLGYFVDPDATALNDILSRARRYRADRNRKLVDNVAAQTGLKLDYERLTRRAEGSLGRPHVAAAMVEEGVVDSVSEAFGLYLAEEGACFVPMERVPYETVIEAIHDADGVASLAHPGRIRSDRVPEMVARLADAGLDAIEVWYPYDSFKSGDGGLGVEEAAVLADRHGLIPTGGSDCHGPGSEKFRIGNVRTPASAFEQLRAAASGV